MHELPNLGSEDLAMDASEVEAVLARAGWTDHRSVPIDDDVSALSNEGYSVWPDLAEFIASFSGLILELRRHEALDTAWIAPKRAVAESFKAWVDDYSRRLSLEMVPIGRAYSDHLLVMAANDGCFYAAFDDELFRIGCSSREMVGVLVTGDGFEELG